MKVGKLKHCSMAIRQFYQNSLLTYSTSPTAQQLLGMLLRSVVQGEFSKLGRRYVRGTKDIFPLGDQTPTLRAKNDEHESMWKQIEQNIRNDG